MADQDSQQLDAKLDNLDDHLEPINEVEDEPKVPKEETPKEPKEGEEQEKDDKEKEPADSDDEEPEEAKEDEYAIDDGEEEPEEEVPTTSTETTTKDLTAEQKYILDNLNPITVKGEVNGKVQEFKVLTPDQLPSGFKFLDDRDMALTTKAFAMLENKAVELQNDYRNQESQKAATDFKTREDNADRQDIGSLQRDGNIPKFKVKANDPAFEKDPASVLIQSVLDYKEEKNNQYTEEYNAGRPYKHIGFQEAFYMYQREHPTDNKAQDKEDQERQEFAKRTSNNRGAKTENEGARVHSGMTSRDLDALIDNLDWS